MGVSCVKKCVYGCPWRPGVRSPAVRSMGNCELPHVGAVNRTRMIQKNSESCSHLSSLREHFLTLKVRNNLSYGPADLLTGICKSYKLGSKYSSQTTKEQAKQNNTL